MLEKVDSHVERRNLHSKAKTVKFLGENVGEMCVLLHSAELSQVGQEATLPENGSRHFCFSRDILPQTKRKAAECGKWMLDGYQNT